MTRSKFQLLSPSEAQIFASRPRSMSVSSTSTTLITEEGRNRPGPTLLKDHNSILHRGPKVLSKLEQHVNYVFAVALKKAPYLSQQYNEWLKDWATKVVTSPSEVPESTVTPDRELKKQICSYAKIIHDGIVEEETYWAEYGELEAGMTSSFHQWCDKHDRSWRHSSGAWTLWKKEWSEAIIEHIDIDLPITRIWKQCLDVATSCLGVDHVPDHACFFIIEKPKIGDDAAQSIIPNQPSKRRLKYEVMEDATRKNINLSHSNNAEVEAFHASLFSNEIFERLRRVQAAVEDDDFDPVETSKQKVWAWMEDWSTQTAATWTVASPMVEIEALTGEVEALACTGEISMEDKYEDTFTEASVTLVALQRNNDETELFTWFGETEVDNLVSAHEF